MTLTNTEAVSDERLLLRELIEIAHERDRGYAERQNGNTVNGRVADKLVALLPRMIEADALSRRAANSAGGVEVKAEPFECTCGRSDDERCSELSCPRDRPSPAVEAEPVAWGTAWQTNYTNGEWHFARQASFSPRDIELGIVKNITPLYTHPSSPVSAEVTAEPKHVPHEVALAGFYEAQKVEVKAKPLYDQCCAIYQAMRAAALNGKV